MLDFGHDGFEVPLETSGRQYRYRYMNLQFKERLNLGVFNVQVTVKILRLDRIIMGVGAD